MPQFHIMLPFTIASANGLPEQRAAKIIVEAASMQEAANVVTARIQAALSPYVLDGDKPRLVEKHAEHEHACVPEHEA